VGNRTKAGAVTDAGNGGARPGPAAAGMALAVLSAGTFATSGIFASALITAGWSPAAAAIARLGGAAVLLTIPALVQLRRRWGLLLREAGRVLIFGLVAMAGGQLCYFNAIESVPVGVAVLLEYLGVVLIAGWLLAGLAGSAQLGAAGIMWGLGEAVSLAAYFLLSAAQPSSLQPGGRECCVLPPAPATSCCCTATRAGSSRWPDWRWSRR
jgi:drug/metabolite transporter (DMT)-like permease